MQKQILIVEDDVKLNNLISEYFKKYNYKTYQAKEYEQVKEILAWREIHLVILDIMLPKINGFEICKMIRKKSQVPILFLSARGEVSDKIVGLEIGADDYMSKPFEPRELLARVEAILRRSKEILSNHFKIGDLRIDWDKKIVYLKEEPLRITYLEFELLSLFAKNKGKILERDFIVNNLHNYEWDGFNRSIDVLVGRLRKKIQDNDKNPIIRTAWGRGYGIE